MSEEKFILDATAGFRMMWFNKKHPNCIYLDQRPECEPDIVGDFRDLKQFPDETFRLVAFDPPHRMKDPNTSQLPGFVKSYGAPLEPETWQNDLKKGFSECWRVLKPFGVLIFKWTDHDIRVQRVQRLFPADALIQQITSGHGKRKHSTRTVWFCFMKIPKKESEQNERVGI